MRYRRTASAPPIIAACLAFSIAACRSQPATPPPAEAGAAETATPGLREHLWAYHVGTPVRSTPVVVGDLVYVGTATGIAAVDRTTGAEKWSTDLGGGVRSELVEADGRIIVVTDAGRILAVDAGDGSSAWSVATQGESARDEWDYHLGSATVVDGIAYLGSSDGTLFAIEARTGTVVWRRDVRSAIHTQPVVAGGRVYVGAAEALHALAGTDGAPVWSHPVDMPTSPAVAGGTVVIGSRNDAHVFALDAASGRVRWSVSHGTSWITGSPVIRDGVAYIGSSDGKQFQAIDLADGTVRWSVNSGANVFSRPAFVGETAIVASGNAYSSPGSGFLSAVTTGGEVKWRLRGRNFFSSPIAHGGMLYVGSDDGFLYAVPAEPPGDNQPR